jgi:DNA-binding CsgD family transcriptional regulator
MSTRGPLLNTGDGLPKLTAKEREVLLLVHPYAKGMSLGQAAMHLKISRDGVKDRLNGIYKRIPWLHDDILQKRKELTRTKQSIRRPSRFGDMSMISNDGDHDTFNNEVIVRTF